MHARLGINRLCVLFYTLVVVLSCTTLGHIQSATFKIYWVTVFVLLSTALIIFNKIYYTQFKAKLDLLLLLYCVWYIYAVIRGINSIDSYLPLVALVICAIMGSQYTFDLHLAKKIIETIAMVATVLLLIQVLWHYIFDGHIQMLPTSILSGDQLDYISVIKTGFSDGSPYYRPSSIFLEPSHYVHYTTIALLLVLFTDVNGKYNISKAITFTIGILATVSSTGIVVLIIFWALWTIKPNNNWNSPQWIKNFIVIILFMCGVMYIMLNNSVLSVYLLRILPSNLSSTILNQEGRFWAIRYLNSFSNIEWLIGRGVATEMPGFYTGYTRIVYRMGLIGLGLYLLIIIRNIIKSNNFSRYVSIAYIVLLFGAEFDVFRYIIFYLTLAFAENNKRYGEIDG